MKYRSLGNTDLQLSEIGFGCGPMAGLIVRGDRKERREAVARALDLGITYFDTASVYGDGLSETHLGETLRELRVRPVVGTKVALQDEDLGDISGAVVRSVEASLQRLGLDGVDILHLHNRVAIARAPGASVAIGTLLTVEEVLGPGGVLDGFKKLRDQGKTRFFGCCAFGGEVPAINKLIDSDSFHSMLAYYNILNPTAEEPPPPSFEGPDYGQVMGRAAAHGIGTVVLRVVAGGALSGVEDRSALAGAIRGTE
jgi:aryl-alcohol dehydrogenase-like predicted oxidoreductase